MSVNKAGYAISGSPKSVTVYYKADPNATAVTFSGLTANGNASTTTTQLTLTFSQAITGLSAADMTISGVAGVSKGTLSASGTTYTLPISGFTAGGTLNVAVAKSGYTISGSPKSVTVYYHTAPAEPPPINYSEMVYVPGGSFEMGTASGGETNERPVHTVTLTGFYMGKYEVTQKQWEVVTNTNE